MDAKNVNSADSVGRIPFVSGRNVERASNRSPNCTLSRPFAARSAHISWNKVLLKRGHARQPCTAFRSIRKIPQTLSVESPNEPLGAAVRSLDRRFAPVLLVVVYTGRRSWPMPDGPVGRNRHSLASSEIMETKYSGLRSGSSDCGSLVIA